MTKAKSCKAICIVDKKKPVIKVLNIVPTSYKKDMKLEKDEKIINVVISEE